MSTLVLAGETVFVVVIGLFLMADGALSLIERWWLRRGGR